MASYRLSVSHFLETIHPDTTPNLFIHWTINTIDCIKSHMVTDSHTIGLSRDNHQAQFLTCFILWCPYVRTLYLLSFVQLMKECDSFIFRIRVSECVNCKGAEWWSMVRVCEWVFIFVDMNERVDRLRSWLCYCVRIRVTAYIIRWTEILH